MIVVQYESSHGAFYPTVTPHAEEQLGWGLEIQGLNAGLALAV
jgi:hypothetical protein